MFPSMFRNYKKDNQNLKHCENQEMLNWFNQYCVSLSLYQTNKKKKNRVFNRKWLKSLLLPNPETNTKIITESAHAHAFIKV